MSIRSFYLAADSPNQVDSMKNVSPLAILLLVSLVSSVAGAEEQSQVFQNAVEAYENNEFELAAQLFLEAYEETPSQTILFALAQSERLSDDCPAALTHYHQLRRKKLPDEDRLRVFQGLELCGVFDAQAVVEEPEVVVATRPSKIEKSSGNDWLGVSLLAGGIVGMGIGTSYWLVSSSQQNDLRRADNEASYLLLESRASTSRTISIVSYAGGAALLAGAALRFWTRGGRDAQGVESDTVVTTGWLGPDGGGVALLGAF